MHSETKNTEGQLTLAAHWTSTFLANKPLSLALYMQNREYAACKTVNMLQEHAQIPFPTRFPSLNRALISTQPLLRIKQLYFIPEDKSERLIVFVFHK